jgi:hypothetical protein
LLAIKLVTFVHSDLETTNRRGKVMVEGVPNSSADATNSNLHTYASHFITKSTGKLQYINHQLQDTGHHYATAKHNWLTMLNG